MNASILIATLTDTHGRQTALWEPDTGRSAACWSLGGGLSHDLPAPGAPVAPSPAAWLHAKEEGTIHLEPAGRAGSLLVEGSEVLPEGIDLPTGCRIEIDGAPVWFERGPLPVDPPESGALAVRALTHAGYVRANNEDNLLVTCTGAFGAAADPAHLLAVMDGCGGHAAGEVASGLAREALADWASRARESPCSSGVALQAALKHTEAALRQACIEVNARVRAEARGNPAARSMATTVCAVLACGNWLVAAHIGDSRIYLQRGGLLRRLTCDHNRSSRMASEGVIPWEEVDAHPESHILTQSVGGVPTHALGKTLELSVHRLHTGDRLLLCTDGLTRMVPETAIAALLQPEVSLEQSAGLLLASALAAGAEDNVTLIVAEVIPPEQSAPATLDATEIPIVSNETPEA